MASGNLDKFMIVSRASVTVREVFDDVCGVLAGLCTGASPTWYASGTPSGHSRRVDAGRGGDRRTALVVGLSRALACLRPRLARAFLCRTQQACDLRAPAVLLVGRPAHGLSDAHRPDGKRSESVRQPRATYGTSQRDEPRRKRNKLIAESPWAFCTNAQF